MTSTPELREKHREKMRRYRANNPDYVQRGRIQKAVQTARRKYWLSLYKTKKGCSECGYNAHGAALDFDHLDLSQKLFHIAQSMAGRSIKAVIAEVRKCRVLCANCHRIHSHQQAQSRRKYGAYPSNLN